MRWGRPAVVGLALVSVGCAPGPDPTPPSATPIPSEPCNAEMVEPALARLPGEEGYRYQNISEHEELRLPADLDNPAFDWVTDRTIGALLAPSRLREEVTSVDPGRSSVGYDALIVVDGRSWLLDRLDGRWHEVRAFIEPNPANAINIILGDQPRTFEVVENVARLRGEGGCVLRAGLAGAHENATIGIRLDPVVGRIVAWTFEQDRGPEPGDGFRQSMLIEYEVPSANEFQPPSTFEPLAPVP
jgi:hypothetical protein